MKRTYPLVALATTLCLLGLAPLVTGQLHGTSPEEPSIFVPKEMAWKDGPPSLPPGAKLSVLEGDPTKEGPFTMRLKLPDRYRIPPHTHPKIERLTVISGTFRLGMGAKFDANNMSTMPAGTYGFWPAGMQHYAEVQGETVVQLHGTGPWQIVYVNPADDPRRSSQ